MAGQKEANDSWHVVSHLHGSVGQFKSLSEARDFAKKKAIPITPVGQGSYFIKKNYGK